MTEPWKIGSDWGNHPEDIPRADAWRPAWPFAMRALTEWPWWWTSTLFHVLKQWGLPISFQCFFFSAGKISYTSLICGLRKVVRTMNGGFNSIIIYTWLHMKVLMRKSWTSHGNLSLGKIIEQHGEFSSRACLISWKREKNRLEVARSPGHCGFPHIFETDRYMGVSENG